VHPDLDASFVCTRCGTFGCRACTFSAVAKREVCRACAQKGLGEPIPWERRKELGNWRAFWSTVQLCSRSPTAFFRTPTTQASSLGAVAHGVLSHTLGLVLTYLVTGALLMLSGGAIALIGQDDASSIVGIFFGAYGCAFAGMSPFALVAGPASALLGIVVAAAASHGTLALLKKTGASFEDTLRALSYANAPGVWVFVPLVGSLTYFWMVGVEVIALRETHRCSTDAAVVAAVAYRVILVVVLVGLYAALIGAFFYAEQSRMGA
jgi:hypothetical protein